jgi:hypothetical protein
MPSVTSASTPSSVAIAPSSQVLAPASSSNGS